MTARAKLSPYERIMRAAYRGRGVRLSSEDVIKLSEDDAIETVALNDATDRGVDTDNVGSYFSLMKRRSS